MNFNYHAQKRSSPAAIPPPPRAPPLPAPSARPLQRARDAASRFLGYSSRPPSPQSSQEDERFTHGSFAFTRSSSIGETQNATTSHKTGLEVKTLSINDSGSHAIIAGKEIFKTVRVQDGHCAEDLNIRSAIRSTPTHASGQTRQIYSIDIADVAWAKKDSGDYVAAATSSGKIIVYDLGHAGLQAAQLHEHYRQVHNITFNPHRGSLLLSGSQDGTVRLWDLRDLRNIRSQASTIQSKRKFSGQSDGVRDVKWSPVEGYDFAFGTDNGDVQRWDMRNLQRPKLRMAAHSLGCNTVDWHPDGKHILSAGSDKTVRVFDVSLSRPKKAAWEIKTAFPVMHARWRPSCQSPMPQDHGAQMCTQIVTSYGKEQPVMHLWDFRRPWLPFRELRQPYDSAPADLLWHSQDLLWTVGGGEKGVFLQTDVQHSPKVIDRCNLQTFDVSPLGELSFVAQARRHRRLPQSHHFAALPPRTNTSLSASPDSSILSRSWTDDSLDNSFLSVQPVKQKGRSSSNSRIHGATSASFLHHRQSAVLKLDVILLNRKSFRPPQMACRGQLPLEQNDPDHLAFMAEHVVARVPAPIIDEQSLRSVENAFKINEESAHAAGLLVTAQTWKLVGHCTLTHLRERIAMRRKRKENKASPDTALLKTSIENLASRLTAQHLNSPTQSPGTMRPISTIARQLAVPESTSNVPTPLARPSSRNDHNGAHHNQLLPDPDKDEKITLPPSLAPTHTSPPPDVSKDTAASDQRLTVGNLEDLQKLESYRDRHDRHDRVKLWNTQSKEPLDLDPVDANGVKIPLSKLNQYGSSESFQFLEESTGSRGSSFPASPESEGSPGADLPSAHPTRPGLQRATESYLTTNQSNEIVPSVHQSMFFQGSGSLASSIARTKESTGNPSFDASAQDFDVANGKIATNDFALQISQPDTQERIPVTHDRELEHSDVFTTNEAVEPINHQKQSRKTSHQAMENVLTSDDAYSLVDSVIDDAEVSLELKKPWTLIEMLQQLLRYYTVDESYAQMASALLLLLGPLLPRTHPLPSSEIHRTLASYVDYFLNSLGWNPDDIPALIKQSFEQPLKAGLQPLQVESILSTYHEQLMAHLLLDEAATLRKLAYPAYPAVYEDFTKDNSVHLMCGQCRKPVEGNTSATRCKHCRKRQADCAICWEQVSPFEGREKSHLFSSCLLCGHIGHAACLEEWFISCKGEGCPLEGCLCDCVAGRWRDEKAALLDEQMTKSKGRDRVKKDEWKIEESKAVEGARNLV